MTTDLIAAARAMIEPLTEYTSAPWAQVSAGDNGYHIGSGGWTVDASDPDGGYFGDWHICLTTGCYLAAEADARLIAAAPDLRDMVPTLADALEAERAENNALSGEIVQLETEVAFLEADYSKAVAERDHALARLAAVIENTKSALAMGDGGYRVNYDPDAQAALDKLLAEARLEGWRAGRGAAADEAQSCTHDPYVVRAIRALPEPREASND